MRGDAGALARRGIARLRSEWLLVCFGLLATALELADPQPARRWLGWLQWPTLATLAGLLIAIQGIRDSGLVQRVAGRLVSRAHSLRRLGLLLVGLTAVLAMFLTNDVSLFLLVPLTLAVGRNTNLPVPRMVVLQALAVNAGSTLSPIGNPQNLLLWQHSGGSLTAFAWAMAPAAAVMLGLVLLLTAGWLPGAPVALSPEALNHRPVHGRLAGLSIAALAAMIGLMEYRHGPLGLAVVVLAFVLLGRDTFARVDWLLLATFAAIFLGLGHLGELPATQRALARIDLARPGMLYLAGILASQAISNVPATVLLLGHGADPLALAVAVDVGGFGLATGSLASLIALRLARLPHGLALLHRVSIPFLLVCAPLVWAVMRWLA